MIRQANYEDISRIAEIIVFGKRVAYRDIFKDDVGSFKMLQVGDLIKELEESPERLNTFLIYDDGIVKGIINCVDYVPDENITLDSDISRNDSVELCEFYVEPFFKGLGIGRQLVENLCREAKVSGKKRVYLWVIEDNEAARRFYERNGFVEEGARRLIEGTRVVDVCYVKEL